VPSISYCSPLSRRPLALPRACGSRSRPPDQSLLLRPLRRLGQSASASSLRAYIPQWHWLRRCRRHRLRHPPDRPPPVAQRRRSK
jgi:hypothetical protein